MLPRLRLELDLMPSPVPEKPGLLIRDPFHYTDAQLIVPPALVECLAFFDGEHSALDLRAYIVEMSGDVSAGELERHLTETLDEAGFLDNENFARRKEEMHQAFAAAPVRWAQHAGSGYPNTPDELQMELRGYLGAEAHTPSKPVLGIAAPHVSPFGGVESYRAAYRSLTPADADRTFVILGTSHYGMPDRFGLTRKPFVSPYGHTTPALDLIDSLATQAAGAVQMEDYCHAVEHSIEFQVIFLQHLFGPNIKILPILCGSFLKSLYEGGLPEDNEHVRRMFGALGDMAAREGSKLCWVLGVDMAHMGQRYGDRFNALAQQGEMTEVAERDRRRITSMEAGDARGFWEQVQHRQDDLKWCGSAPIYSFLRAVPEARGELCHYQQWNIDEASVVSFAGMRFRS
ncbi:MAG: AmmeMemoRadiSam system protein [Acidobacteriota bacterium]|jgi:AmmeMemoRadiSam system protein B